MPLSYDECLTLIENDALRRKAKVAVLVLTNKIRLEAPAVANHAQRMVWAKEAATNPDPYVTPMLWQAIIQNQTTAANPAAVTAATDAVIQTAIDGAVDLFL